MKNRKTYKILTIIGAWIDLFYMDKTFDEAMAKRGFMNTNTRNEQGHINTS